MAVPCWLITRSNVTSSGTRGASRRPASQVLRRVRLILWWMLQAFGAVREKSCPHSANVCDIDLAVTPATNTLPIRRLNLEVGQSQEVTAAWLKFPDLT